MNRSTRTFATNDPLYGILVIGVIGAALVFSLDPYTPGFKLILTVTVGLPLLAIILREPFYGLVAIVCSLPLITLLPDVPISTSATSFLGGITLGSYLMKQRSMSRTQVNNSTLPRPRSTVMELALAFVYWAVATGFFAVVGGQTNWVFTFAQLIILMWLMSTMMTTVRHHVVLMAMFTLSTAFSSLFIIRDALTSSAGLYQLSLIGLSDGANNIARYGAVSVVFAIYLMSLSRSMFVKSIIGLIMGILILGVTYTLSRSGILLVMLAFAIMLVKRFPTSTQTRAFVLFIGVGVGIFLVPSEAFNEVKYQVFPALERGTSVTDIRLDLWDAAIRMTEDHPIAGVGLGQYKVRLSEYGTGKAEGSTAGAHNMYLQVMAETGVVGLVLFVLLLLSGVKVLWQASRHSDLELSALAWTWLSALIVLMVGGLTKHDFYGKLIWVCLGAGVTFQKLNWLPSLPQGVKNVANIRDRRIII